MSGREAIVVIPARAGSKGVPNKNLAHVGGVALVARAIRSALGASTELTVTVSTDSQVIAEIARKEGAKVVARPASLSGDEASSESALTHALTTTQNESQGPLPKKTLLLQCTSPFVQSSDIDKVVHALDRFDSVFTAIHDHAFRWVCDQNKGALGVNHDMTRPRMRRQDLEEVFRETGAIYGMNTERYLVEQNRFFGAVGVVLTPPEFSMEVDSPADLEVARALADYADAEVRQNPDMSAIRGVAFDFDGVMTDNHVTVDETGRESVQCSRSDGMGVELLRQAGIPMVIITKERNTCANFRGGKLQISVLGSVDDKKHALELWAKGQSLTLEEIAFIGNDVNDLPVLRSVGLSVCPADAQVQVRRESHLRLSSSGGHGAVREFAEMLLSSRRGSEDGQRSW